MTKRMFCAAALTVALTGPLSAQPADPSRFPIDLPTALRLADANNPTANIARARVRQAVAQLDRAKLAWVPTLVFGPTFFYHGGLDQGRSGAIVSLERGTFTLGVGPAMRVDVADALYLPLVARRGLQAETSRSRAVANAVQLDVALAYMDVVEAHGLLAVNADTLTRAEQVLASAESGARAGLNKTAADVNRAATEVNLRRQERFVLQGRVAATAARLGQLLGLDSDAELTPHEAAVVPVVMVPFDQNQAQLADLARRNRPEIAAAEAELQAAGAMVDHAKASPFLPRVQSDFVGGGFAAGVNSTFTPLRGSYNTTTALVWQLDGFGFGNAATVRGREAGQSGAAFRVREVQLMVAAEVKAAAAYAGARHLALEPAQAAVREATEMYRKLRDVSFGLVGPKGEFDTREALTALVALNNARVAYLQQVVEFNRAQFRLFTALGQPAVCGIDAAQPRPLDVPAVPDRR